jgi:LAS superfamily LD-carboxypeptidase LdcB
MAARPGTSNHGLGLAVDFAEERNGKPGVESVSPAFVKWLDKNANRFGFFREFSSGAEPWHWRYVAGDAIPPDVLSFPG